MGNCKDNMQTTCKKDDKDTTGKTFLGILSRKRKKESIENTAQTLADMVVLADACIGKLVTQKEVELQNEAGREEYNRKALAILKTIAFHVDEIVEQIAQYDEI